MLDSCERAAENRAPVPMSALSNENEHNDGDVSDNVFFDSLRQRYTADRKADDGSGAEFGEYHKG